MPEVLGKALRYFAHQRFERDGSGLEFANWRKRHDVKGTVLLPNQVGDLFERIG